ncbi:MAG: hypothetical protein SGI89_15195 [bacterium]|nr:hypothetical protein [bacterium]
MPELYKLILIEVTDKYFLGTRTRLRRMENTDTHEIQYKLTKKYGKISPQSEPLTTLYLTESEFNFYNCLNGSILIKKIYRYPFESKIFFD